MHNGKLYPNMIKLNTLINYFKKTLIRNTGKNEDFSYLRAIPRYQPVEITLFSHKFKLLDSASFLFQYNEIFASQIYKFKTNNSKPYIIDCGANIGLSIIYFKRLYPSAKIIGFEPDKQIFNVLSYNINSFNLKGITLINKALWNLETTMKFFAEGSDGGRIAVKGDKENIVEIQTTSLRKYISKTVDFLKIDIEGAETRVMENCEDLLYRVDKIFIEYHSFLKETQSLDKILRILTKSSFRYYISNIGVKRQYPFIGNDLWTGMDNQLNIFAIRK